VDDDAPCGNVTICRSNMGESDSDQSINGNVVRIFLGSNIFCFVMCESRIVFISGFLKIGYATYEGYCMLFGPRQSSESVSASPHTYFRPRPPPSHFLPP